MTYSKCFDVHKKIQNSIWPKYLRQGLLSNWVTKCCQESKLDFITYDSHTFAFFTTVAPNTFFQFYRSQRKWKLIWCTPTTFKFFTSHASQSIPPRPENFFVANIDQKLMDCLPATSSVAFSADLALPTLSNISGFTQKICPLNWYWMIPQLLFFATEKRKYATQKEKEKIKEQPLLRIRIGFKIRFPLEYFSLHVSWQVIKIWPSLENISIFEKKSIKIHYLLLQAWHSWIWHFQLCW